MSLPAKVGTMPEDAYGRWYLLPPEVDLKPIHPQIERRLCLRDTLVGPVMANEER